MADQARDIEELKEGIIFIKKRLENYSLLIAKIDLLEQFCAWLVAISMGQHADPIAAVEAFRKSQHERFKKAQEREGNVDAERAEIIKAQVLDDFLDDVRSRLKPTGDK